MSPRYLLSAVMAVAVLFSVSGAQAAAPPAPSSGAVNYNTFHDRLAAHGSWVHNTRWGDVWRPGIAGFRPYYDRGHWVYTADYGWYWNADDDWGDVVFHYGRWVFDPVQGWVWIPGYVWGPGWVAWRWGDGYAGWMPEPPDYAFLTGGIDIGFGFGAWDAGFYGYQGWYGGAVVPANLWVFVGGGHLADPYFARYAVPRAQVASFIGRTRNVTRYTLRDGFVASRSIDVRQVQRLSGHRITPVAARTLVHSNFAAVRASVGRQVASREMARHPVEAAAVRSVSRVRTRTVNTTTRRMARSAYRAPSAYHMRTRTVRNTNRAMTRSAYRAPSSYHARTRTGPATHVTAHHYARYGAKTLGYSRSSASHAFRPSAGFARTAPHMAPFGPAYGVGGGFHPAAPRPSAGHAAPAPGRRPG